MKRWLLSSLCLLVLAVPVVKAQDKPEFTRTEDVIYGRKFGLALTLDVFQPAKNGNHRGLIVVISGGWFSTPDAIAPACPTGRAWCGSPTIATPTPCSRARSTSTTAVCRSTMPASSTTIRSPR